MVIDDLSNIKKEDNSFFPNLVPDGSKNWSKGTTKQGWGARPILESEIKEAQKNAQSAFEAARNLGVSYNTYKKWAKIYGLFDDVKNQSGKGISKGGQLRSGAYALTDILDGNHPDYPIGKLKRRLMDTGTFPCKCFNCELEEKRVTDGKVPLLLDFIDGDKRNKKAENLRFLCYNCYFYLSGNLNGSNSTLQIEEDETEDSEF